MALTNEISAPLRHADRFFIGGEWVKPSTDAVIDVIDSATEQHFFSVAEAQEADVTRAVGAARQAFDQGPWPRMTHGQRAEYLRAISTELQNRAEDIGQIWPRESGVLHFIATASVAGAAGTFEYYAGLADTFPFEEEARPSMGGEFGLLVREPVGVVGAIIPWNAPLSLITYKIAPALLAGCTVVLKASPEAPGEAYVVAEVAEAVGLPPGVLNVVTADREVSELARARSPRRQNHFHRLHGGRSAHRLPLRGADRALHPGARRQVRRGHPRRHGPGDGRRHARPRRVLPGRSGLLVADPHRGHAEPAR